MALTPEELKNIPSDFVNLYQELEDFIIKDFSRRIAKVGKITDSAKWQAIRAEEIGISLKKIEKEVSRITGISQALLDEILKEIAGYSIAKENLSYSDVGLGALDINKHTSLQNIVKAAIEQTSGDLFNLTQSLGFAQKVNGKVVYKPIAKYYQDAMDLAVMQIKSGVTDYNTAIKQAVNKLCESGIRSVDYESGVANKIDVAVRRAVLSGANQMSQKLTLQGMDELDADFVETTAHVGARPSHALWQGKVFCYSGKSKEYPPFIESTGYGTGAGLGGWNCRHSFYPFFPGISERAYTSEDLKRIDPKPFEYNGKKYNYYEASQHQRSIERAIRKTKTQLIGYDAAGLKTDFTNSSIKLKRQEKYYNEFSKVANIPTEKDKLQAIGFNKSISQKSVWAKKKYELEEFQKFKEVLVNEAPNTIEEFRYLMYNKPKEWELLKGYYDETKARNLWLTANFPNEKKFKQHVEKHSWEYGNITSEEYLNRARKLLASKISDSIYGFTSKDGFVFRYDIVNNDFALGRKDGNISTLFKPDRKLSYWKDQVKLFGGDD